MAFTRGADGTRIHYDVWGQRQGEWLLLIQGLGADIRGWIAQRHALGARYRCIALDNRGVGRSDRPDGPYDLEVMAADAVAVLDAAGIASAHVMGASMGGILAQILAVGHPGGCGRSCSPARRAVTCPGGWSCSRVGPIRLATPG
ncbi:MAG: alpha/beta hydrolase [Acidimicrobiales bacterium]